MSEQTGEREVLELREALAAANARLEDRTRELIGLLRVSANLTSQLDLQPLLHLIIEEVQAIADYGRASVYLAEGEDLRVLASRSSRGQINVAPPSHAIPAAGTGGLWERVSKREAVLIDDMHTDERFVPAMKVAMGEERFNMALSNVHSQLVVPLALKDRVIGMLTLTHEKPGYYTQHHADLVSAIGAQAAIAIENARLFEQAQNAAATTERQRLARELHDSVSQALYGIALGARTARTLLDVDAAKVVEPLEYVLQLASAGQAEMRALLFELRPESLAMEGLVVALEKQIDATAARYGIDVVGDLGPEPDLSLTEKEVFYRIGQEALHNVVKHARADRIEVRLAIDEGHLRLEVSDDGIGFDTGRAFPGHMGLVSMNERASNIGATLTLESAEGVGTSVRLSLPL